MRHDAAGPWQLLVLSAPTTSALEEATERLIACLETDPARELPDIAYTLQMQPHAFPYRRMLVCHGREDALQALQSRDSKRVCDRVARDDPYLTFMFPGIGDHYVEMAWGLHRNVPFFRNEVDRCCELVEMQAGLDLRSVLYPASNDAGPSRPGEPDGAPGERRIDLRRMLGRGGDDDDAQGLIETNSAQPALFIIEYALARLWVHWGIRPNALIGHSLGEYVAACLAGVFSVADTLRLVVERARLISDLPGGAMVGVSLSEQQIIPNLQDGLCLAAVNAPSLCVVSGTHAAVETLKARLRKENVAWQPLLVRHAFHSTMMQPVADRLTELVRGCQRHTPKIPYISNMTGTWITAGQATDPTYWSRHLCGTVRFSAGLRTLLQREKQILLEVGPGHALCSFATQHHEYGRAKKLTALASLRHGYDRQQDFPLLLNTLGRYWLAGGTVHWSQLHHGRTPKQVSLSAPLASGKANPSPVKYLPEQSRSFIDTPYSAPEGAVEQWLACIWEKLLRVEPVGRCDDFFRLGGHSLLGTQVLARIHSAFGVKLPARAPYDAPTVAELARLIEQTIISQIEVLAEDEVLTLSKDDPLGRDAKASGRPRHREPEDGARGGTNQPTPPTSGEPES